MVKRLSRAIRIHGVDLDGVKKRFQDGTFILGCPAYGYAKDEAGELIIKDEEAVVVRRIFKEYLNGKGSYVIAKGLS